MKKLKNLLAILIISLLCLTAVGCVKLVDFEDIEIVAEENEFFNVTDYLVYYDEDGNAWFGTATVTDNDGNNVQMINYIFKVEKSSYNVKITVKNDTKVIGTRNIKVKKA